MKGTSKCTEVNIQARFIKEIMLWYCKKCQLEAFFHFSIQLAIALATFIMLCQYKTFP